MATDPFDGVGVLTQEIGQPTFVELIYTQRRTGKTIRPKRPDVLTALPNLAFNTRPPLGSHDPAYPHIIAPTPQRSKARTYSLTGSSQSISSQDLMSNGLHSILRNSFIPQDVDCAFTTLRGLGCIPSGCKIDLVFALDTTATMGTVLDDLKENILKIIDLLDVVSGNYRVALVSFDDAVTVHTLLDAGCMANSSTNTPFSAFITSLNSLTASGGGADPDNSDGALEAAIIGEAGLWRDGSFKVVILITDALPGGDRNIYDNDTQERVGDLALQAGSCGINIIAINTGVGLTNSTVRQIMEHYAIQSNGKYLELADGKNVPAYVAAFLRDLCQPATTECVNAAINGSFDTTISGWTQNGSASWSSVGTNGFMILDNGSVEQTIMNLTPGNRIRLRLKVAGIIGSGEVYVELNGSGGVQPIGGGLNIFNGITIERNALVSPTGTATIIIENRTSPNQLPIYIDDVSLCEIESTACGFGTHNLVLNPEFEDGVDEWTDTDNVQLPETSWDSSLQAIIVDAAAVRTAIDGLVAGQNLVLMFEVYENLPTTNDNLEFTWVAKDNNDVVLGSGTLINSTTTFPIQVNAALAVPEGFEGPLYIQFASGGTAKVKSVYCCDPGGYCSTGMTRLSFDQFTTNRGGWAGGTLNNKAIDLSAPGSGNDILQQTYFELVPKTILHLSVNCITTGGIIVEMFYTDNRVIDQFFSSTTVGVKSFASLVPENAGRVTIRIRARNNAITVDDILLCQGAQPDCDGSITNLRTYIEWNGVPRTPTNIFNVIARITYRDPEDPFKLTVTNLISIHDGRWGLLTPANCNGPGTCDFWKQQGDAGIAQDSITSLGLFPVTIGTIKAGDIANITTRRNWLWSVPANRDGNAQDGLVTLWDDPPVGLIQSIQFLILANHINPIVGTPPVCPGPFAGCAEDPADSFDFIVRYRNSRNEDREFRTTFHKASLYQISTDFTTPPWDTISALDNGIRGNSARWEEATFILDTVDGRGSDQCTQPLFFSAVGQGNLVFSKFGLEGEAQAVPGCDTEIRIEEITKGVVIDEVQSIILPNPSGGRWVIEFTYNGVANSTSIPWNANANQVRLYLESLPNIGGAGNVAVTGSGSTTDPFLVEFTRELGGRDLQLMSGHGNDLTGTGSAAVSRLQDGTRNEQQTITKVAGVTTYLKVTFSGVTSDNIPYNASLNEMQAALMAMSTIGAGNVTVSGDIDDPNAGYQGPWRVRFTGMLGAVNVPDLTTTTNGYTIVTDWQGGVGVNELQLITVVANDGTYVLIIPNPNPTGGVVITDVIDWNASAAEVSAAITAVAPWLVGNIKVTKLPHDPNNPNTVQWTVEFKGDYAGTAMELMQAIPIGLRLTKLTIAEVVKGGGTRERQRVQIIDSNFGFYRLVVNIFGSTYTSAVIRWNSTSETVQEILQAMPPFGADGDVIVTECTTTVEKAVACHLISFHPRFGDVDLMQSINRLSCNPLGIGAAQSPPYPFDIPECDTPTPEAEYNEFVCTPGPLLCKPGEGDPFEEEGPCCEQDGIRDSANVYSELILQRELFDPHQRKTPGGVPGDYLTIKDLAVLRGLKPAQYNAYLRDFKTGALIATDFSITVETKMSVVLIEKTEDTTPARRRIIKQLQTSRNILPSRMTWETVPQ